MQFDVHRRRVWGVVGHVERAEERLARLAGPQDPRVARAGVDLRPVICRRYWAPPQWSPWACVSRMARTPRQSSPSWPISDLSRPAAA